MTGVVSRADRVRDAIGVLLMAGGAALYAYAYAGMKRVSNKAIVVSSFRFDNINEYNRYWAYSYYAMYLFVLGIGIALFSAWLHLRRRRRQLP
ncbi:MAG: hypothetical protein M3081_06620 [Gemmatimonadota bacterium]|nr:hypothetical protein [Gemmatimonadota bacterium]